VDGRVIYNSETVFRRLISMGKRLKCNTKTFSFEISGFAYFEDRRFDISPCEEFIFIEKKFISSQFPKFGSVVNQYIPQEYPMLIPEERKSQFIFILELKVLLSKNVYNKILSELVARINCFDQTNILIKFLLEYDDFDKNTINSIIVAFLRNKQIRGSFNAQRKIIEFIDKNFDLIEQDLIREILLSFPHGSTSVKKSDHDKHNELVKKVELALVHSGKKVQFRGRELKKGNVYSPESLQKRNFDIEAGEEELEKWDKEDSSWRIANDLD
jgi:hypothetical protein